MRQYRIRSHSENDVFKYYPEYREAHPLKIWYQRWWDYQEPDPRNAFRMGDRYITVYRNTLEEAEEFLRDKAKTDAVYDTNIQKLIAGNKARKEEKQRTTIKRRWNP